MPVAASGSPRRSPGAGGVESLAFNRMAGPCRRRLRNGRALDVAGRRRLGDLSRAGAVPRWPRWRSVGTAGRWSPAAWASGCWSGTSPAAAPHTPHRPPATAPSHRAPSLAKPTPLGDSDDGAPRQRHRRRDGSALGWERHRNLRAPLIGHSGSVEDVAVSRDGAGYLRRLRQDDSGLGRRQRSRLGEPLIGHNGCARERHLRPYGQRSLRRQTTATVILWA